MSLGVKMQALKARLNIKLGRQDATVTVRQLNSSSQAEFGAGYDSNAFSDVVLEEGVRLGWAKTNQVDRGGTVQLGDLMLDIPGHLITEEQLQGATVLYKDKLYPIQSAMPRKIVSGVPVSFIVTARAKE